jgi:hypothetical protein
MQPQFKSSTIVDKTEKKITLDKLRNPNLIQQISFGGIKHPGEDSDVPYVSDIAM